MMHPIPWHLWLMAGLYVLAGILHFIYPKTYVRIMPSFIRPPRFFVYLSGAFEVISGIGLLFQATRKVSIFLIIAMLVVFLSVHFNMLNSQKASFGLPRWILLMRIPLQLVLMYWAYSYL